MKAAKTQVTVSFRVAEDVRDFYVQHAQKESRRLSEVLRRALEEQLARLQLRAKKSK
jgi:uncharacterized protein YbjQ (UPF0145 family)